ncbi:lanthionine synthetase LanC family protein [Halalkalibacter hemicellulosilyticus]|uniref:Lanthionine biosynthesis protein LanM n=1 Tax=Halalkalibacter hemicellulosilyticusJCM 9152 TaxID=1236971 RepID=W4QL66_9BACI|nr:lanthionine synthetase LanC family protein [Halalkalibacter hemicellulosilyticus]GAE32084.1 lanthionine biosynthesis protein LanM [Halalkalibacter hemicellulosilyticusJCM 9152]
MLASLEKCQLVLKASYCELLNETLFKRTIEDSTFLYNRWIDREEKKASHKPMEALDLHLDERANLWNSGDLEQLFLEEAESIFKEIWHSRMGNGDDEMTWVFKQRGDSNDKIIRSTGWDLFEGRTGIALFFAALYAINRDELVKEAVKRVLSPLLEDIQSGVGTDQETISLGKAYGIAGIVQALFFVGEYVDEKSYKENALSLLYQVTVLNIQSDLLLDILEGTAGLLSVVSDLYAQTQDKNMISLGNVLAEHLMKCRVESELGVKVWLSNSRNQLLTGFGHGISGMAHALYKWYRITGHLPYKKAAEEALQYEGLTSEGEESSWLDFKDRSHFDTLEQPFMAGWCSGAPGIGLARLTMFQKADISFQRDLKRALAFTEWSSVQGVDHLCYGNAGRLDFLLEASVVMNNDHLFHTARQKQKWVIEQKRVRGHYVLNSLEGGRSFYPSLFQGLSGIGYVMLRCINAKKIRSILT